MEQNNVVGVPNTQEQPVASAQPNPIEQALAEAPAEPTPMNVPMGMPTKTGKGMILGMIIFAILAAGGIGFGVWAMMDGNTQKANYDKQISDLKAQNSKLLDQIAEGDGGELIFTNPIVTPTDASNYYTVYLSTTSYNDRYISIDIKNGEISSCRTAHKIYYENGGSTSSDQKDCVISGLDGKIYYAVEFGAGQDNEGDGVGFVMTDGTVKYFLLKNAIDNNDFSIQGSLNIDGYVVNTVGVDVGSTDSIGGYRATVFVLKDGTLVKYDSSLLK